MKIIQGDCREVLAVMADASVAAMASRRIEGDAGLFAKVDHTAHSGSAV
jgi:hypothetical protein